MLKSVGLFLGLLGLAVTLGSAFAAIDEKAFDPAVQNWDYDANGLTLRLSETESFFAPPDVAPAMIFIVSTAQRMGATVRFGYDSRKQILYMVKPERAAASGTGGGVPADPTKPDEREFDAVNQFWDYSGNGLTLWFSASESYFAPQEVATAMVFTVATAQETGATVRIGFERATGRITWMSKPEGGKKSEGDVNRDGEVNALDVVFVINKVLGM